MPIQSVNRRWPDTANESIERGIRRIMVVQTYIVITDVVNEPIGNIVNAPGIPALNDTFAYQSDTVRCVAKRPQSDANSRRKWLVMVTYSNDTEDRPVDNQGQPSQVSTDIAPWVTIDWFTEMDEVREAQFDGVYTASQLKDGGTKETFVPKKLNTTEDFLAGTVGPIVNSAMQPQPGAAQKPFTRAIVRHHSYQRPWDNTWDTYINAVNTDEVTLSMSDASGPQWTRIFPAYSLKCTDVEMQREWKQGELSFLRVVVMSYHPDSQGGQQRHFDLEDKGTVRHIFAGQWKEDGSVYDTDALVNEFGLGVPSGQSKLKVDGKTTSVSSEFNLNGYGMQLPVRNPANSTPSEIHFMRYKIYLNEKAFMPLFA